MKEAFLDQLRKFAAGGPDFLDQIQNRRYAKLRTHPGETVPYVRIGGETTDRPLLCVPGFIASIEAKAPIVLDLASRGFQVMVANQNRTGTIPDATIGQAENLLAVLAAEGLDRQPSSVNVITHSYGSLVFDAMIKLANQRELPCFQDSTVIMLDPSGSIFRDSFLRLSVRFGLNMVMELFTDKEFPDSTGEMLRAGLHMALSNPGRTWREIREIASRTVDYQQLINSDISQLIVLSFALSRVFPARALAQTMAAASESQATATFRWASTVSSTATHNDDQCNPTRVGAAIAALLREPLS